MKEELIHIQNWLKDNCYAACIVPQADPHGSEYIEAHYKLIKYLSGFTGSAGTLVITTGKAAFFTDSRYHIQAAEQLSGSGIELMKCGLPDVPTYIKWTASEVKGGNVAANASLFSVNKWAEMAAEFSVTDNAGFEAVWTGRPALCPSPVFIHDVKYSGEGTREKLSRVRAILKDKNADFCVVSNLDDIAWLLNIRGGDVAYNPVVRSFVAITQTECHIFVDAGKVNADVRKYFKENGVQVGDYSDIEVFIEKQLAEVALFDKGGINQHIYGILEKCAGQVDAPLYVSHLRAVKNSVEIEGYRSAMLKDGVVWVRLYKWFNESLIANKPITEIDVMDKLRALKSEQPLFIDESFGTIAGYGSHGAIGHYAATEESNATIEHKGLLVIDTGTHYLDGTTDTTRTLVCGTLTDEERRDYTLVLKGHIALGRAIFPKGTKGSQLDILARQYLWNESLSYGHGTGHGVGHLLNVHEGYAWLRPSENNVCYEAGLTMTDEPGIYREGKHGIRIENTVLVTPHSKSEFGEFLTFEHLTIAPYAIGAIDKSLLTTDEINFLNNYNSNMREKLKPLLTVEEYEFLKTITYEI